MTPPFSGLVRVDGPSAASTADKHHYAWFLRVNGIHYPEALAHHRHRLIEFATDLGGQGPTEVLPVRLAPVGERAVPLPLIIGELLINLQKRSLEHLDHLDDAQRPARAVQHDRHHAGLGSGFDPQIFGPARGRRRRLEAPHNELPELVGHLGAVAEAEDVVRGVGVRRRGGVNVRVPESTDFVGHGLMIVRSAERRLLKAIVAACACRPDF